MNNFGYNQSAQDYALRPIGGTDLLAFRELEKRIQSQGLSGAALDAGCGAGRSTRFLRSLGLKAIGLDISEAMIREARKIDPAGDYRLYSPDSAFPFPSESFDVVLSMWVVVELDSYASLLFYLQETSRTLRPGGVAFIVSNTPEFFGRKWVSCDTDFPENKPPLRSGQAVKVLLNPEGVVISDTYWSDHDYRMAFGAAGFRQTGEYCPVAPPDETGWFDESTVAPYVIYELQKPA